MKPLGQTHKTIISVQNSPRNNEEKKDGKDDTKKKNAFQSAKAVNLDTERLSQKFQQLPY